MLHLAAEPSGRPCVETSFLDLDIKVIGYNIQTSGYDKHDDFRFAPSWVVMLLESLSTVFRNWVNLLDAVLTVWHVIASCMRCTLKN